MILSARCNPWSSTIVPMSDLEDKTARKLRDAFERAATAAGYRMVVRESFGLRLRFEDFAADTATSMALEQVTDMAVEALRRQGIRLSFGSGDWGGLKPDRFTVIVDREGKALYGAATWEF